MVVVFTAEVDATLAPLHGVSWNLRVQQSQKTTLYRMENNRAPAQRYMEIDHKHTCKKFHGTYSYVKINNIEAMIFF
jgi:hypothetical protein